MMLASNEESSSEKTIDALMHDDVVVSFLKMAVFATFGLPKVIW